MNCSLKDLTLGIAKKLRVALALTSLTLGTATAGLVTEAPLKSSGFGTLPLYFQAGVGATSADFPYLARGRACNFFVGATEAVLVLNQMDTPLPRGPHELADPVGTPELKTRELRFEFVGADPAACVNGADELSGKANYFLGNNPAQWRTSVPLFGRVRVAQMYPGVDLVYYGNEQRLEYDFVVAPKADPGRIAIHFTGADGVQVNPAGELVFTLGRETIRQPKPLAYQEVNGVRKPIAGGYALTTPQTVTFKLGDYDSALPLVIDPVLSYSTFYGGKGPDAAWGVAVDTNGFVYVVGETMGALPTTPSTVANHFQGAGGLKGDAFVAKFNNAASSLIYLSYLGGSADDVGLALAVDDGGNAYVTGYTDSTNFPTQNPIQRNLSGSRYPGLNLTPIDAFVTKLGPAGTNLIYSTYLGGDWKDEGVGIAVDKAGAAYVTGYTESTNFPTLTTLAGRTNYGGGGDAFLTKISTGGNNLVYSMYLGGTNQDAGSGVAVNGEGVAFVTGYTGSGDFPIFQPTNIPSFGFYQPRLVGGRNAFITVMGATGIMPVYSTYLGGSGNSAAFRIALDAASDFYVTGFKTADSSFPITPSALNPGGVFRSDNGATNWISSSTGLVSILATSLAVDASTPTTLYAGTSRGVARSDDGGASWKSTTLSVIGPTNVSSPSVAVGTVYALAINPGPPATLYAGTGFQGVYQSRDGGTTWSLNSTDLLNQVVSELALDPITPATIYAATGGGVYQSTNSATNWSAINKDLGNLNVRGLVLDPTAPATLYAATGAGVYRTTNSGAAWHALNLGLANRSTHAIAMDPVTPTTLYVGTDAGVFKSINAGTNWSEINAGLTVSNISALAIDPLAPATLYAGTFNGLFKSSDAGESWSMVTNGLAVPHVLCLAVNPQATATLYAGTSGTTSFGGEDVFIFKSGSNGYSSIFGGVANDEGWDVAVDATGHAHIVGVTYSTNFPTQNTSGFLRATNSGGADAFVAELSADGGSLVQSAYFGGSGRDLAYGIALDPAGNSYFVGKTSSTNFPTLHPFQNTLGGGTNAFLAKLLVDTTGPALQIARTGSGATLSWPPYWPEFSLQTATDLTATNAWITLGTVPFQTNGTLNVQLGTTNAAGYFRLRR